MADQHDVVIVGARCAGAALATFLARSGASVVVLESGRLGSDQVLSTHTIHPAGMDVLEELGVAAEVLAGCPPARRIRFEVDGAHADVEPPDGRYECCPRRYRLDGLLQQTAAAAGADIRERTRVIEVLRNGDRIVGVRAENDGRRNEVRGRVTVGADGRHSTVARLVGAEEYLGYRAPRGMYWAYWEPPPVWKVEAYPYDNLLRFSGLNRRVIFSTDQGQLLLATLPLIETARKWKSDLESHYLNDLRSDTEFAPLVEGGKMVSKVIGTLSERYFFRRSAGPGWALVGDAGHHKDPIIGWGISEALVQAKLLSKAIQNGSDTALELYWRQRDVDALPRFRLGEERGAPTPITPVFPVVLKRVARTPGLPQAVFRETEYDSDPYGVIPASKLVRWILGEAFRCARPHLLLDFLAQGRRVAAVRAEVRNRRILLTSVPPS